MDSKTLDFGKIIAYLLPGFVGLWGLCPWSLTVRSWFKISERDGFSLDSVSFVVIGSLALGIVLTGFRWVLFDKFLVPRVARLGKPRVNIRALQDEKVLEAFKLLVESHWTYYQFYAGMAVAIAMAFLSWILAGNHWTPLKAAPYVVITLTLFVLYFSAVEALGSYRQRTLDLLGPAMEEESNAERD